MISESVYLEKDKYYYMELYQSKSYSSWYYKYADYLQISVEIPNDNDNVTGNVFGVHKFRTFFDPDPEILEFTQKGAQSGYITMKLIRRQGLTITYQNQRTIPYNCSIENFLQAL